MANPVGYGFGCGPAPGYSPFGGIFGGGSSWILILLLLVFLFPNFSCLFKGGSSWILILLLIILILPGFGRPAAPVVQQAPNL